jgi:hypothetical protein
VQDENDQADQGDEVDPHIQLSEFPKKNINYHNALEDVKATLKLFNKLIEK